MMQKMLMGALVVLLGLAATAQADSILGVTLGSGGAQRDHDLWPTHPPEIIQLGAQTLESGSRDHGGRWCLRRSVAGSCHGLIAAG